MRRGLFINISYLNTKSELNADFIAAFDIPDIQILEGEDTTKDRILAEINNKISKSRYGDELVLFISCKCDNFNNQILTHDGENISSQELETVIFKNKNLTITIIIDCFNLNNLFKLPYKYLSPTQHIEISSFGLGRKILFLSSYSLQHGMLPNLLLDCKKKQKTKWCEVVDNLAQTCSLKSVVCATSTLQKLDDVIIF